MNPNMRASITFLKCIKASKAKETDDALTAIEITNCINICETSSAPHKCINNHKILKEFLISVTCANQHLLQIRKNSFLHSNYCNIYFQEKI